MPTDVAESDVQTRGRDLSAADFDQPIYKDDATKTYVLCSSPRCGSTYLCSLLTQTRRLGVPFEYVHFQNWAIKLARRWGLSASPETNLDDYFDLVKRYRTTPNGVFGLKAHASQALPLASKGDLSRLVGPESVFIHLERQNLVQQAVSLSIAGITRSYESSTPGLDVTPAYDNKSILKSLQIIQQNHNAWQRFFVLNNISPLTLVYEDVLQDPAGAVHKLGRHIGVDVSDFQPVDSIYKIQRTELNLAWEKQFRAEHGGY